MGGINSGRRKGYKRMLTVEACERINVYELPHVAPVVSVPIGNTRASKPFRSCPGCGSRSLFLYRPPGTTQWRCRRCHRLTWKSTQSVGTRAELEAAKAREFEAYGQKAYQERLDSIIAEGKPINRQTILDLLAAIERDFETQWKQRHRSYNRRRKSPRDGTL